MTTQEFAQAWNEVFPNSKINPNELGNPTGGFLINALVVLFRSISIDVSLSEFDAASHDPETIQRNKLCLFQYVNEMYRSLHNKKFHYFDFIHPTPKKTLNLLQSLLNFVLYYHMVEDEMESDSSALINKHRELVDKKAHMKKEREKNKIQVQHGEKTIEALHDQIQEINGQIVAEKKVQTVKNFEENTAQKQKQIQRLAGLKVNVSKLSSQCINEDDYEQIKLTIFEIEETITEKQEALEKLTANHERLCVEIDSLEKKITLMAAVSEIIPEGKAIAPGKVNDKKEELLRLMIKFEENKKMIEESNGQIEKFQQDLNMLIKKNKSMNEFWAQKVAPMTKLEETLVAADREAVSAAELCKERVDKAKGELMFMQETLTTAMDLLMLN